MVEAKNFVEKELGKSLDEENVIEQEPETTKNIPTYTPPPKPVQEPIPAEPQFIQQPPTIQIVEKIVYKKQRIHGFFRTLTIIALLAIGFLMLGESTGMITLSINSFKLHQIFPLVIIFSTIIIRSYRGIFWKIFGLILFLSVFWWIFTIGIYTSLNPSSKWKSGNNLNYTINNTGKDTKENIYIGTLIGNSYIDGDEKNDTIIGTWNSDRNLWVTSWQNGKIAYLKFNEDNNRNVLENYQSKLDLTLPSKKVFELLYIKNFLWLHTIDLNDIQWKMVKFHAGIDDITLRVGNVTSGNKIEIQGTAANIQLDIPKDVWVMMYYKHFIGMLDTPQFDSLSWHYFQSQNISGAKTTLNIYVNLGLGNTKINRVEPKK